MSLRAQLAIFTSLLVAAAVVAVSLVAYFATRDRLLSQIDSTLQTRSQAVGDAPGLPSRPPPDGDRNRRRTPQTAVHVSVMIEWV